MRRRAFLTVAGAVAVAHPMRNVECGMRNWTVGRRFRIPNSAFRIGLSQEPSLSPEVFARRLDRARGELKARGLDLLIATRSEEHTSELQSQSNLVCRLLLEKKKKKKISHE